MKNIFQRPWALICGVVAFFKIVRNPKDQLDAVFEISARLADPKLLSRIGNHVADRAPYAQIALEEWPRTNLKQLLEDPTSLPEGSLGKEFSNFIKSRGIDPADLAIFPVDSREDYILANLYETHDLWHVLCGFDTHTNGELGLQAFYLAQMPTPLSLILIAAGLVNSALFAIEERDERMSEIVRGWNMGRKAKILFGVDWTRYWASPLAEIRQIFALS